MLTALILSMTLPAQAQEAPPVVNGTATSSYEQVGSLVACTSGGCADFCSGTLVDADWVVTAAHCVEALDDYVRYYGATPYILFGRSISSYTDYAEIIDWVEHPSYNSSSLQNDIGVLELDANVTSMSPMPMNTDSPGTFTVSSLRYVGYGITSDRASDSGTKRYADIPLYSYDAQFIVSYDSSGTYNVCSGDSGGAGLEYQSDGSWELAAVNSYVTPGCVGGATGGARVDAYHSWITGYTGAITDGSTGGGSTGGGSTGGSSTGGGSTGGDSGDSGGSTGGDSGGDSGSSTGGDSGGSDSGSDGSGDDGTSDVPADEVDDGSGDAPAEVEWGDMDADAGDFEKGGCATVGAGAAPVALLAWMGAMAVARRRED